MQAALASTWHSLDIMPFILDIGSRRSHTHVGALASGLKLGMISTRFPFVSTCKASHGAGLHSFSASIWARLSSSNMCNKHVRHNVVRIMHVPSTYLHPANAVCHGFPRWSHAFACNTGSLQHHTCSLLPNTKLAAVVEKTPSLDTPSIIATVFPTRTMSQYQKHK